MITFTELLKRAKREKIAIHTATEDQAITLLSEFDKNGFTWCGGEKLTSATHYEDDKENTCYDFSIDTHGKLLDKKVCYCWFNWYQDKGYTIVEFDDIDLEN